MAQKVFICEGDIGTDILQRQPLAGCIADGYVVTSVSGYSTRDNRQMCVVLLSEPTTQASENSTDSNTEQQGDTSETQGDNTEQGGETEPQGEP